MLGIFLRLCVFSGGLLARGSDCQHSETVFRCVQFVRNYDGDTVTFEIPDVHPLLGREISIRVAGVDTPEIRTKDACEKRLATAARNRVRDLLSKAKRIDLHNVQRGKYFRIVADVNIDGMSLKDVLLQSKLALPYDGGKKQRASWCSQTHRLPAGEKRD